MIFREVMFGYVENEKTGNHEVWAESAAMLADRMRDGSFAMERSISVLKPDLDVLIEIAGDTGTTITDTDAATRAHYTPPTLPTTLHCYGTTYRLVVRETFRQVRSM